MIAALFVETDGCYFGLPGVDPLLRTTRPRARAQLAKDTETKE